MSSFFINTARLMPYTKRPRGATGYVTVWSFEPRPDDSLAELGNLYAVIEVISGGREAEEVVDLTLETIRQAYYEDDAAAEAVDRFEVATKAVNRTLTEYVNRGNAGWVGKMSAVLAVLQGDQLHAAYTGSAEAYLYRGGHAAQISQQSQSRVQQPSKIFGSIASGQLEIGDKLLLATPALVHQLSLKQLQTVMLDQVPTGAVAKIATLLEGRPADRIAALVLEFTTPERAAEQTIPVAAPRSYTLAQPNQLLEQAKATAAPIVGNAAKQSRKLGARLHDTARANWPRWREAGWRLADRLRHWLQKPRHLRIAAIAAGVIILLIAIMAIFGHHSSGNTTALTSQFRSLAGQATQDTTLADNGQTSIRPDIATLLTKVQQLAAGKHQATINKWLNTQTTAGLPQSVASLEQELRTDLDTMDHLATISPQTVANLTSLHPKSALTQLVLTTSQALSLTASGTLYATNLANGSTKAVSSSLGDVVATTASGDTAYILTKEPAVWRYQTADDSLTKLSLPNGNIWPNATAIATYGSNLYLLTPSGVDKYVASGRGFTTPVTSLTASTIGINDGTLLAIDGAISIGNSHQIVRYLTGTLAGRGDLPSGFTGFTQLLPGNGSYLLAADAQTGRIAVLTLSGQTLNASKEYTLATGKLSVVAVDPAAGTLYFINGTKLQKYAVGSF